MEVWIGVATVCKADLGAHQTGVGLVEATEVAETGVDLAAAEEDSEVEIETVHQCDDGLPHVVVLHEGAVVVVLGVDHAALGVHHQGEDRQDVPDHRVAGVVAEGLQEDRDHLNAKRLPEVVGVEGIRPHRPRPLHQVKCFHSCDQVQ